MEQADKSKIDKYNERLQRARNAIKNKTSLASTPVGAISSDEIKVGVSSAAEEEIVPTKDNATEEDVPVFRDGKWYTRDGREVQVKKVLRFTWKW